MSEWIKKCDPTVSCLQGNYFKYKDTQKLEVNGRRKIIHSSNNQKKAGVDLLVLDKADFPLRSGTSQGCPLSPLLFNTVLAALATKQSDKKKK